jgi:hypothetical protein
LLASGVVRAPQTWNRYTYVLNNPVNNIDPLGLACSPSPTCPGSPPPDQVIAQESQQEQQQQGPLTDAQLNELGAPPPLRPPINVNINVAPADIYVNAPLPGGKYFSGVASEVDAFIAILSGAHGLSEINTRVRPDQALQRAFGRQGCAEQSVVQETLSACTAKNVVEMQAAVAELFRVHSAAYRHDYEAELQVLDADLSGLACGKRAEQARKGYFSQERARYGRPLGWALVKEGDYERPVRRLALRWRTRNGQRCHALLISTVEAEDVLRLVGRPLAQRADPQAVLVAYAELYDQRGGTVEIELKESKQGVGLAKRNKKSYTGQQMVVLLGQLAHNVIV